MHSHISACQAGYTLGFASLSSHYCYSVRSKLVSSQVVCL